MFAQIDETLPADIRQNERGDHIDTGRLQHDHQERQESPIGMLAHREVCPPGLNRNQESNPGPYQSRDIQLHFCSGQYEIAESQQDSRDCQTQNNREQHRDVGKGVHRAIFSNQLDDSKAEKLGIRISRHCASNCFQRRNGCPIKNVPNSRFPVR